MVTEDWSTRSGLREISQIRSAAIPGWQAPVAYAVGFLRDDKWVFPYVNKPGGPHGLPAVILAETVGHRSGSHEYRVTSDQLAHAIAQLAPAEAATDISHPNLAAWRAVRAAGAGEIVAIFVGDVDDPPAGPADTALRSEF